MRAANIVGAAILSVFAGIFLPLFPLAALWWWLILLESSKKKKEPQRPKKPAMRMRIKDYDYWPN